MKGKDQSELHICFLLKKEEEEIDSNLVLEISGISH